MTAAERTKARFAQALRDLLRRKDFIAIRVSDLCREADCRRATFYYHFEDKYALVAWIYVDSQEKIFGTQEYTPERFILAAQSLWQDAPFYRKALADEAMTGLYRHVIRYYSQLFEQIVERRRGPQALDEAMHYAIRYAACAGFMMTREWLFNGGMDAREAVTRMIDNMPARLRKAIFDA